MGTLWVPFPPGTKRWPGLNLRSQVKLLSALPLCHRSGPYEPYFEMTDWNGHYSTHNDRLNNGTAHFKKRKQLFEYQNLLLETSGGKSSNLYLNVVHFFNTSVN